jgi:hypothetical protein
MSSFRIEGGRKMHGTCFPMGEKTKRIQVIVLFS